jgi:hypothetical protein
MFFFWFPRLPFQSDSRIYTALTESQTQNGATTMQTPFLWKEKRTYLSRRNHTQTPHITHHLSPSTSSALRNIQQLLQLDNQLPLILANIAPKELLERVDALAAHKRVQRVVLLEMATVHGLIGSFDLNSDRGLALLADGDLLVVALDGSAVTTCVSMLKTTWGEWRGKQIRTRDPN